MSMNNERTTRRLLNRQVLGLSLINRSFRLQRRSGGIRDCLTKPRSRSSPPFLHVNDRFFEAVSGHLLDVNERELRGMAPPIMIVVRISAPKCACLCVAGPVRFPLTCGTSETVLRLKEPIAVPIAVPTRV